MGPIFNREVSNWDEHLDKLCDFWSSVLLMTGIYNGTPMRAHATLSEISAAHLDRWLTIFRSTVADVCTPQAAALFVDRAERIAQSLERGITIHCGQLLGSGERLVGGDAIP